MKIKFVGKEDDEFPLGVVRVFEITKENCYTAGFYEDKRKFGKPRKQFQIWSEDKTNPVEVWFSKEVQSWEDYFDYLGKLVRLIYIDDELYFEDERIHVE